MGHWSRELRERCAIIFLHAGPDSFREFGKIDGACTHSHSLIQLGPDISMRLDANDFAFCIFHLPSNRFSGYTVIPQCQHTSWRQQAGTRTSMGPTSLLGLGGSEYDCTRAVQLTTLPQFSWPPLAVECRRMRVRQTARGLWPHVNCNTPWRFPLEKTYRRTFHFAR